MRRGVLFVVSGPSGVGKGTVLRDVLANCKGITFSVSATTRQPRPGEKHGVNYFYITEEEFLSLVAKNEMLEYVHKFTNYYGTPKKAVEDLLNKGLDVLLEIETIGGMNVKNIMPDAVLIFIAPPSLDELQRRLEQRGRDVEDNFALRTKFAREEIETAKSNYDYIVLNEKVEVCAKKVEAIIEAERCKVSVNGHRIDKILG